MSSGIRQTSLFAFLFVLARAALSQTGEIHGQASGWITPDRGTASELQSGIRYIPDILIREQLSDGFDANLELSLNSYATAHFAGNQPPAYDWNAKPYRAWLRLSTDRFETRIGLQKINFGSASFLRPLMWFDRIDPRDPLQLTDGVYGVLARYYFQDNANVWFWGLYGNDGTKGWELAPTEKKTPEYGGRLQLPLFSGEIGATYHHRRADESLQVSALSVPGNLIAPEDRVGLDGKWDIGIGIWFEAVMIRQQNDLLGMHYQRQWTVGTDYTFGAGNGLYIAAEYFRSDLSDRPFGVQAGSGFSALSVNYPVDMLDQVSGIVYRDWTGHEWYRLATWQRTYDNWIFYLLGFWNPRDIRLFNSQSGANPFAGTGVQILVVFNH